MSRSIYSAGSVRVALCAVFIASAAHLAASGVTQTTQPKPGDPTNPKAIKTYASALDWEKHGGNTVAVDTFLAANKQDGGHCISCLSHAFTLAYQIADLKAAETALRAWLPLVQSDAERAALHLRLGLTLQREGIDKKKESCFSESCDEFKAGLAQDPGLDAVHYGMGVSLAYLHQDDAARNEFNTFLSQDKDNAALHARAQRFAERVELARSKLAPPFQITTIDGRRVTMDSLVGKVVLIDFWATWCGPCREALPHMQRVVKEFAGQPFVAISISLDPDESKWKTFVEKNGMTWLQARDGSFKGSMSTTFAVNAIPATFSIDADGVLEDQHVGDASIDGKLKKMIARAVEVSNRKSAAAPPSQEHGSGE